MPGQEAPAFTARAASTCPACLPHAMRTAGAALDVLDSDDDTALSLAIQYSHPACVRALVLAKASLARLSAEQLRSVVRLLAQACQVGASAVLRGLATGRRSPRLLRTGLPWEVPLTSRLPACPALAAGCPLPAPALQEETGAE